LGTIFVELDISSNNVIEKIGNEIAHEQQSFVCVLEIQAIETPKEDLN
jgi:hypothetical protein